MNEWMKQTRRQADRQPCKETDIQTNTQTKRQRAIPIEGQIDRRTDTDKGTELEPAYISQLSLLSLK